MNRQKKSGLGRYGIWFPLVYAYKGISAAVRKCWAVLFIVTVLAGWYLYWVYYRCFVPENGLTGPLLSALYSTVRLFGFSSDFSAAKITSGIRYDCGLVVSRSAYLGMIEAVRFIAPLFTGVALVKALKPVFREIDAWIRVSLPTLRGVVVHASPSIRSALGKNCKDHCVIPAETESSFHAAKHIIAFDSDEETLNYYKQNAGKFRAGSDTEVYLCLQSTRWTEVREDSLIVSSTSENCARAYWDKYFLRRFTDADGNERKGPREERSKVILIGFGDFGEAVFNQSLLVNVFLQNEPGVEYHIFGDTEDYFRRHTDMLTAEPKAFSCDRFCFHSYDEYLDAKEVFRGADRIIIAGDSDSENCRVFENLILCCTCLPQIHIRQRSDSVMKNLYPAKPGTSSKDAVTCDAVSMDVTYSVFGTDRELYTEELVIGQERKKKAEKVNDQYEQTSEQNKKQDEKKRKPSRAFKKKSSAASTDHDPVRIRQASRSDVDNRYAEWFEKTDRQELVPGQEKYSFCEMEHIRWDRFELLLNVRYAEEKMQSRKQHNCLVPFDQLPDDTKKYDWDPFIVLNDRESGNKKGR